MSVVVPAHDEGTVIGRCLQAVGVRPGRIVVVAANGCTDDTVDVAQARGAHVVVVEQASKVAALNAGDAVAGAVFPRIYLDADMELDPGALDALTATLGATSDPLVAMPRLSFDLEKSSVLVQAFFRMYTRMPYMREGLIGAGCYAVNAAGRRRWDSFPDVVADDLFVQGLFAPEERRILSSHTCTARAPRNLRALVKVRTRTYLGNRQAVGRGMAGTMADSTSRSQREFFNLVRRDFSLLPSALVYAAVNLYARWRAGRLSADSPWLRDDTSR